MIDEAAKINYSILSRWAAALRVGLHRRTASVEFQKIYTVTSSIVSVY